VGVPAELIPDPLLLLPRLAQSFDVAVRRSALRSSTPLLEGSYIVVHGSSPDAVPAVARAVERLRSERPDLQVVTANLGAEDGEGGFSAALAAEGVEAIGEGRMRAADVVALVAGARVVASSARWVRSIANAFGVPAVATSTREGAFADSGVLLGAASRRSTPPAADVAVVDAHLDRLAELLREVAPADGSVAPRLVLDRLAALDRALAEADHEPRWLIHELLERLEEARILGRDTAARLGAETARRTAAEGAAAELAALEATRTFRATRRLRAFYGAVRARLPRLPG
jgi:hypothetical protein